MPMKDKMEKIPWDKFKDNLNILEDILAKQVKGVEKELQHARERYEEDSESHGEPNSYITEDLFEDDDEEEEGDQSEKEDDGIDEEEIDKFILNEEERKLKKNIWIQHNSAWIEKQKARNHDLDKNEKRKTRKKAESKQGKDVFESIKNTKLG